MKNKYPETLQNYFISDTMSVKDIIIRHRKKVNEGRIKRVKRILKSNAGLSSTEIIGIGAIVSSVLSVLFIIFY